MEGRGGTYWLIIIIWYWSKNNTLIKTCKTLTIKWRMMSKKFIQYYSIINHYLFILQPKDHISTSVPYIWPFKISGATYQGEPQSVTKRPVSVEEVLLAKPKSARFYTSDRNPTDFDITCFTINKNIFRFQITMSNI